MPLTSVNFGATSTSKRFRMVIIILENLHDILVSYCGRQRKGAYIPVEVETVESEVADNENREESRGELIPYFVQSAEEAVALKNLRA